MVYICVLCVVCVSACGVFVLCMVCVCMWCMYIICSMCVLHMCVLCVVCVHVCGVWYVVCVCVCPGRHWTRDHSCSLGGVSLALGFCPWLQSYLAHCPWQEASHHFCPCVQTGVTRPPGSTGQRGSPGTVLHGDYCSVIAGRCPAGPGRCVPGTCVGSRLQG